MILAHWNGVTDWWLIPSVYIKKTDSGFYAGFRFLKFEVDFLAWKE